MNWLTGESGSLAGQRIEVTGDLVVGRSGADIEIDDAQVSRRHAAIRPVGDGIEVEDLGSTNGTWVNERRISGRQPLVSGDTLRIGGTVLRAATDRVVPPVPAAPPPALGTPVAAVPAPVAAPAFDPARGKRQPATRSYFATTIVLAIIVADAIALIVYFAGR